MHDLEKQQVAVGNLERQFATAFTELNVCRAEF